MIAVNQIYLFIIAISIGIVAGILYEGNCICRFFCKLKIVTICVDILFWILFAVVYIWLATIYFLPNFRVYLAIGCCVGFFFYYKSFHKILAFVAKSCYNQFRKFLLRRKLCKMKKQEEK